MENSDQPQPGPPADSLQYWAKLEGRNQVQAQDLLRGCQQPASRKSALAVWAIFAAGIVATIGIATAIAVLV